MQAPPAEFRFADDSPDWMRGRTRAEVNSIAAQLASLAASAVQNQPVAPVAPQPQGQPPAGPQIGPDDWVTGAHLQAIGQQVLQQAQFAAQQGAAPAIDMMASTNLELVKKEYPAEFGRYGHEIYGKLAHVPKTGWTVDNLRTVVKLSLVDHVDELADLKAAQLAATRQDPALRASGTGGTNSPLATPSPEDRLTDAQKSVLRRQGLTPQVVADQAAKFGMPLEKWYERFAQTSVGDAP